MGENGPGDSEPGRGYRKVYFNLNGAVPGQKDYYYLRVFLDPTDPRHPDNNDGPAPDWAEVKICELSFKGPYSSQTDAENDATPDLSCNSTCTVNNVVLNTDGACSGNNATFSVDFDVTGGSGHYEIYATAANATYGISVGDVLGTMTGAATTGTALTITGTVTGPTTAAESISCLLYTSPSPRDGLLSRMPSSA